MDIVRMGIIGMGGVGRHHAHYLAAGAVTGASFAAFSTRDPQHRALAAELFPHAAAFANHDEFLASGTCDAVLIAAPHLQHPALARQALAAGMHVLIEKPLAVSASAARQLVSDAAAYPHLLFGIMLNQRAHPIHLKIRELVRNGDLGEITRITWLATHWFRPWSYFRSSPWRATWAGEGGGVLINQCHHNLDLLCWILGTMPSRVTAVGFAGKAHPIETEDEVSAILEYPGESGPYHGAIGHLVTSTGEFPGVNRLEIAGTRARLVAEDNQLAITRSSTDAREFMRTSPEPFGAPDAQREETAMAALDVPDHQLIAQDFVDAIRRCRTSETLLAPAAEGLRAVELGNAIQMSALQRIPIHLPLDAAAYDAFLATREPLILSPQTLS